MAIRPNLFVSRMPPFANKNTNWKRSVGQNTDQIRTNPKGQIYHRTTLPYNKHACLPQETVKYSRNVKIPRRVKTRTEVSVASRSSDLPLVHFIFNSDLKNDC